MDKRSLGNGNSEKSTKQTQSLTSGLTTLEVIIGIDFGTRFTKVAIGREGQDPTVWRPADGGRLIPSLVYVTDAGMVSAWPHSQPKDALRVEYLKMLLARPDDAAFALPASIRDGHKTIDLVRPLAALFLSEIIRRVRASEQVKHALRGTNIRWLVNVGVPVEHFDGPERATFREVAAVAFEWQQTPPTDLKLATLMTAYASQAKVIDLDTSPTSVFPELSAALIEYVGDPNRPEGLYGFCDIGGGTVDGAIFRLKRGHLPPLVVLSASVAPYGSAAVAHLLANRLLASGPPERLEGLVAKIEGLIVERALIPPNARQLSAELFHKYGIKVSDDLQNFVRNFVNTARLKQGAAGHTFIDPISRAKIELRFLLAGGGATSGWYRSKIRELDPEQNQAFDGVRNVRLEIIRAPRHFRGKNFERFVIAVGLTNSPDGLEEASKWLPRAIPVKPPPPGRPSIQPITKDDV